MVRREYGILVENCFLLLYLNSLPGLRIDEKKGATIWHYEEGVPEDDNNMLRDPNPFSYIVVGNVVGSSRDETIGSDSHQVVVWNAFYVMFYSLSPCPQNPSDADEVVGLLL